MDYEHAFIRKLKKIYGTDMEYMKVQHKKGWPDYLVIANGYPMFYEVKGKANAASPTTSLFREGQLEFLLRNSEIAKLAFKNESSNWTIYDVVEDEDGIDFLVHEIL